MPLYQSQWSMAMPAWSGLFDGVHNTPHSLINQQPNIERDISRQLRKPGNRALKGLIRALTGAATGGTATEQYRRVTAVRADSNFNMGGVRPIEVVSDVNRVTTSADKTRIDNITDARFSPQTYPVDRSGNGGGSKVGRL
jgi:hypothetical protein